VGGFCGFQVEDYRSEELQGEPQLPLQCNGLSLTPSAEFLPALAEVPAQTRKNGSYQHWPNIDAMA